MDVLENYATAVDRLKDAESRNIAAHLEFAETLRPKLNDLSMVGQIREWYQQTARECRFKGDGKGNNKQFVFLILNLYSPASLIGGSINKSLRRAIASTLGITAGHAIYKMRSLAIAWYRTYPRFQNECNTAILKIDEKLSAKEQA